MGIGHLVYMREKENFKVGDIVIYKNYDLRFGGEKDFTPIIFQITKIDDLSRAWYGDDCIGTAYIRHANNCEKKWYKEITIGFVRKQKILKINKYET